MNPISRIIHWLGSGRAAERLRRRARRTAEPAERVALLERAVALGDVPAARMELAVAAARCGWLEQAAASWRRAVELQPVLIPGDAELAALAPVLPLAAADVLRAMSGARRVSRRRHWKLERRGAFDGEERWKLEQEEHWTMDELLPTLRFIAQAVAHAAGTPGRVRIDCDRLDRDADGDEMLQMGEAILHWDGQRRLTTVTVNE